MEDNKINFYQIFKFGGTIGVNKMDLSDVLFANFMTLIVMILLIGTLATLVPFFILILYTLSVILGSWDEMDEQRIMMNLISIIGYVYFMIDYHFGFLGWRFFHTFLGTELVDKFCYINTGLFLFNVLLLFYGNKIFKSVGLPIGRLLVFIVMLFIGYKVLVPIGGVLAPLITKQYVPKPSETNVEGTTNESTKEFEDEEVNENYWEVDSFDE